MVNREKEAGVINVTSYIQTINDRMRAAVPSSFKRRRKRARLPPPSHVVESSVRKVDDSSKKNEEMVVSSHVVSRSLGKKRLSPVKEVNEVNSKEGKEVNEVIVVPKGIRSYVGELRRKISVLTSDLAVCRGNLGKLNH